MKKYKLKNKSRFYFAVLITSVLTALCVISFLNNDKVQGKSVNDYTTITVECGDNLWDISNRFNKDGQDTRKILYEIKKANNLKNEVLQPGQTLKIPTDI